MSSSPLMWRCISISKRLSRSRFLSEWARVESGVERTSELLERRGGQGHLGGSPRGWRPAGELRLDRRPLTAIQRSTLVLDGPSRARERPPEARSGERARGARTQLGELLARCPPRLLGQKALERVP
jgi:hypothetical protein